MKHKVVIYPYKMGSESAKDLAHALGCLRVFPDKEFVPRPEHLVINWGNGCRPKWDGSNFIFLNRPEAICRAIEKITAFRAFLRDKVSIPTYTLDADQAMDWIKKGQWTVCRTVLEGMDGFGLVLAKKPAELVEARLYTKYVPIAREYRAYIFMGRMIDVLDKRRATVEKADPDIRTESRGWVFCKNPAVVPKGLEEEAIKAIKSLGLDFGGVDIILGEDKKLYVLEVNTAPGIGGDTTIKFKQAIKQFDASV